MRHRWYLFPVLLGVLLLAAACVGDNATPENGDGEEGGDVGASIGEPMEIVGLTWTSAVSGTTGEPVDNVESFTTISPAVVAVVEARDVAADTDFTATWSIDGIDVPETTMTVTVEEDLAVAWIAFEFIREEGRYFPLGQLQVTVTAISGEAIESTVDIRLP